MMDLPEIATYFEDAAREVINDGGTFDGSSELQKLVQVEAARAVRDIAQRARTKIQEDLRLCPVGSLGVHIERDA